MKRLVSFLLALLMCATMVPTATSAAGTDELEIRWLDEFVWPHYSFFPKAENGWLFPVFNEDEKCGLMNLDGEIILPLEYDSVSEFSENLTRIEKYGKYGFVNTMGEIVVPLIYDYIGALSNDLAAVEKDGKWGFVNANGEIVIPLEYDDVYDFSEGLGAVYKGGKWGVVNTKGEVVLPVEYDEIECCANLIFVRKGTSTGVFIYEREEEDRTAERDEDTQTDNPDEERETDDKNSLPGWVVPVVAGAGVTGVLLIVIAMKKKNKAK